MIYKMGQVNIDFSAVNDVISILPPRSIIDYPNDISTLNTGRHSTTELQNYSEYTLDKLKNFKYQSPELDKLFPDSFLIEHGLDITSKRVFVLVQPPGAFVAPHYDQFSMSKLSGEHIVRMWVALEDAKFGQALFVESTCLTEFKAGDVFVFDKNDLHSSANAGLENRYTMLVYANKLFPQ